MSFLDRWFKPTATWREKATALDAQLAETTAMIDQLRAEAAELALRGSAGDAAAEKRLGVIEAEMTTLAARVEWVNQALAQAQGKANAEEAAAAAEQRQQAKEAEDRRVADLAEQYKPGAEAIEAAVRRLIELCDENLVVAAAFVDASAVPDARRMLNRSNIRERLTATSWLTLKSWVNYQINDASQMAKVGSFAEVERRGIDDILSKRSGGTR